MSQSTDNSTLVVTRNARWYGRIPIATTLVLAMGILILTTAGVVFGVGAWIAQKNTFDLLSENANEGMIADSNQIESHLQPAEHQTRFIASRISSGLIDPTDHDDFGSLLVGALAGVPQIEAVLFTDINLQTFIATRNTTDDDEQVTLEAIDNSDDEIVRNNLIKIAEGPIWLPPIWRDDFQKTYLMRAHPVLREEEYIGAVVAVVSVAQFSNFIGDKDFEGSGNQFVLYGRDSVLAHWLMAVEYPNRTSSNPLPELSKFTDPILASIWEPETREDLVLDFPQGAYGHRLEVFNERYAYIYKILTGFGDKPLIVGTYFQASDFPKELERLIAALIASAVVLFLSLIAAIFIGRKIARPIVKFSKAASRIQNFNLSDVEILPGSVFRELNDQAVAFNAMLSALHWFEYYMPKKIVDQLVKNGTMQESISDAREITVMFTDIVGFSTASEGMLAPELAKFLNEHFSLVVECIEAENGIVDKYMGDAVMAYWSGSEGERHSANDACSAALAISDAISRENRKRENHNKPVIELRIGIHTGMATIGNIGAPGRFNYTIIGDSVNIGQRLEQLGKEVSSHDKETTILISADTKVNLTSAFDPKIVGNYQLKGRATNIDVYRL